MIDALSAHLPVWGYALLVLFNAVGRCGVPLPSSALMLCLGALVVGSPGELGAAIALAYGAALAGDLAAYPLGRRGGAWIARRAAARPKLGALLRQAESLTERWGALAVLLSRWPLSTLGPYVNLVAGALGLPWRRYLGWCLAGELVWVSLYLGLGYAFAAQLDRVMAASGRTSAWALGLAGAALLAAALWRWHRARARLPKPD